MWCSERALACAQRSSTGTPQRHGLAQSGRSRASERGRPREASRSRPGRAGSRSRSCCRLRQRRDPPGGDRERGRDVGAVLEPMPAHRLQHLLLVAGQLHVEVQPDVVTAEELERLVERELMLGQFVQRVAETKAGRDVELDNVGPGVNGRLQRGQRVLRLRAPQLHDARSRAAGRAHLRTGSRAGAARRSRSRPAGRRPRSCGRRRARRLRPPAPAAQACWRQNLIEPCEPEELAFRPRLDHPVGVEHDRSPGESFALHLLVRLRRVDPEREPAARKPGRRLRRPRPGAARDGRRSHTATSPVADRW